MLPHPKNFFEVTKEEIWAHINVNVAAATAMTEIVLPGMMRRRRGAIVNIASSAAIYPVPKLGIYAATKVCLFFIMCHIYSYLSLYCNS